jgi:nucleoside-diphosphate-sugar epimerase
MADLLGNDPVGGALVPFPELDLSAYADSFDRSGTIVDVTRSFLRSATAAGQTHILVVSSAMVYGAWPNNPAPIDEDVPVRPVPSFGFAVACATAEALVERWRTESTGRTVTVLRPVPVVEPGNPSRLVRALADALGGEAVSADHAAQFLHRDDLEAAKSTVRRLRPDAVLNVAPDGAILGERLHELSSHALPVALPAWARSFVDAVRWRFLNGPVPPGLREYARHSWHVSNARLRTLGWEPRVSNDEAYVAGSEAPWTDAISAKRRQEIALAGSVAGLLAAVAVIGRFVRRRR